MAIAIKEKSQVKEVGKITGPSFRDPSTMTAEELTDPDYAKKRLARDFGDGNINILTCSKCHHCRR